ncbi:MAG: polysaccharide pyruvyl transferase family protein [Desulfobulbaceae bacterium]|nr:polysaccharide pyruvyl transferase family protein [Desulfobulbaceae bacterium]
MKTITVLGNNSGRNAGDNAILGNLLDDFALERSDILFQIPTLNTRFIRSHFGHHPIRPMGMMPWNLALKNLGWPLYRAMTRTQMVLITDNILFDRKFNNPLVNNLKSIALVSSLCKKKGIPIVFYNASIGPIDHQVGKDALQKVLDASPLVITRDVHTKELLEDLQVRHPEIVVHADCALNTRLPAESRLQEIIDKEDLFKGPNGTIGLNVNAYIDDWSQRGSLDREDFCKIIAATADTLIEKLDVDVLFTVTQIMDMKITRECVRHIRRKDRIRVVGNKDYTYQELAGLLGKVAVHAGLRTHTLIFCAAVGTPMISINAYPKSAGFLKTIGMGDWSINFDDLSVENLSGLMQRAWQERNRLRTQMQPIVESEKKKARDSVALVGKVLEGL